MELEARAAALLRERGEALVPVAELHRELARERAEEVGDAGGLQQRLSARPDLFVVLQRAGLLLGCEVWTPADRAAYEAALREAGWEGGALVCATPATSPRAGGAELAASLLASSLAQLAAAPPGAGAGAGAGALHSRLDEALPLAAATVKALRGKG